MSLLSILLDAAPAASTNGGQQSSGLFGGYEGMIMIIVLVVIFYFFMIRPQSQKQKKINEFRNSLKKGDRVMTAGGIYGTIREVKDTTIKLMIDDGVTITIDKSMIYQKAQDVAETGSDPQANK